jgi:hypothetical protein
LLDITDDKGPSSLLLGRAFSRLSAKIAPLVRAELVGALVAELERHFNEQLLSELHERVEIIVERELPKRVAAILTSELSQRVEMIIDSVLPSKYLQIYRPNNIVAGSVPGEYMAASNTFARDFLHPE